MKALRVLAQQHVGRPAAAANKNLLSVYHKRTPVRRKQLRRDVADAETCVRFVGSLVVHIEFQVQAIKIRGPHLCRPPQAWVSEIQLGKFVRLERYILGFACGQFHILCEFYVFDLAF